MFAGSVQLHKVVGIAPGGSARDHATGLDAVLGVRVDRAHGLLWVATDALPGWAGFAADRPPSAALAALDLETGPVRHRFAIPADGKPHLLNDVAVAPDGAAHATDTPGDAV